MYGNELYNILTECEPQPPMTLAELRERLKHIAVCCSGLSIDLANEITLREKLTAERDRLQQENDVLRDEIRRVKSKLNSRKSAKNAYRKKCGLPLVTE